MVGRKYMRKKRYVKKAMAPRVGLKTYWQNTSAFGRGPELKSVDTAITMQISSTPTATALNLLATGTDQFNRIGKRTTGKYLELNLSLQSLGYNAASAPDHVRTIVVYDRQVDGVGASYGQVMQSFNSGGGATGDSFAHRNADNQDRFVILMDDDQFIPAQTALGIFQPSSGCSRFLIRKKILLKNLQSNYSAATAVITSVAGGSFYIYTVSQYNVAANTTWQWVGFARYVFTDA